MRERGAAVLQPRKTPVQERSAASVEAILKATLQVLLRVGKEKLTTTLVAERAGVSVGTLYQYFPNKGALLHAVLRRHLLLVTEAVEQACEGQHGASARTMVAAVTEAFIDAKMREPKGSVALYAVSADLDASRLVREMRDRTAKAVAEMLGTAREPLDVDGRAMAAILHGALTGVSRWYLEGDTSERSLSVMREELLRLVDGYVQLCTRPAPAPSG